MIIIYNLKAKLRDKSVKANQLKRNGIVPATIYGKGFKESILIQIALIDANRFLSTVSKGNMLTVEVEEKKYNVILKEISYEPVTQQVQNIEFQNIVADQAVNSVMKVILLNKEKNQNLIQQQIEEIPYNALPKDFVQEVVIDLDGIQAETIIKISDLDVAKNENIRIAMPEDSVVVTVAYQKRMSLEKAPDNSDEKE